MCIDSLTILVLELCTLYVLLVLELYTLIGHKFVLKKIIGDKI